MKPAAGAPRRRFGNRALGVALLFASLGASRAAWATEPCADLEPWSRLGTSAQHFAAPAPLAETALAVIAPFGFAPSGLDYELRLVSQRDLFGRPRLEPVTIWAPALIGGGLVLGYGVGAALGSCSVKRVVSPVLEAGVLTFGTVTLLKFATGRSYPNGGRDPRAPDRLQHPERARDFAPFRRGFGAWPSGHTALMFAGAAAFRASLPELGWVSWLGYPLAVGVAGGMWLGDHHWASDIVSGALLGEAIGGSVGLSFSEALGMPGALIASPTLGRGFGVVWLAAF